MTNYRLNSPTVEAKLFDGSKKSREEILAWFADKHVASFHRPETPEWLEDTPNGNKVLVKAIPEAVGFTPRGATGVVWIPVNHYVLQTVQDPLLDTVNTPEIQVATVEWFEHNYTPSDSV